MQLLASRLRTRGWPTQVFSYPTVKRDLKRSAAKLQRIIINSRYCTVHIAAHSLGGLLSLFALQTMAGDKVKRVVLLGTPLAGSKVAQRLTELPLLQHSLGHSAEWLLRGCQKLPGDTSIGMLAGSRSVGLGRLIRPTAEPNDGTVMVSETRRPELQDHLVTATSHTGMLFSRQLAAQTDHFFRQGRFARQ